MSSQPARSRRWLLPVLASAALLAACTKPGPAPDPVRSVKVVTVGTSAYQSGLEYSGEVRPRIESRLGFRVAGKIVKRQAQLGQRVKPGEVLAQLDAQDYRLAADAARAQVNAAKTNRDLAAADLKRYQVLRDQNFISGAELERRDTAFRAAQAQLDQASAQLASQSNQARYADLVADVAGVITAVDAEPGQVVTAGMPVVRIAVDGPRDVLFSVPEDKIAAVRTGSPVAVKVWSGGRFDGQVREVAASADPVTRTFTVKVGIDGSTQPPLGTTASVALQSPAMAGTQVVKLPTSALRQEGKGSAVWVLDRSTMTVRSQPVQVATADGNEAVIAAGVQPGMTIVAAGVHVLQPGQKVRIWDERAGAPAASAANVPQGAVQPVVSR
jgi:membrane fusion protein, multidrug efflux system